MVVVVEVDVAAAAVEQLTQLPLLTWAVETSPHARAVQFVVVESSNPSLENRG